MRGQKRGEETRTHILDAAEECFARHGYDATSVAEICHCADLSKGAFYHHFSSKQALFLALLERWLARLDTQLGAARTEDSNIPETLLSMSRMMRQVFQQASGKLSMFLEFWTKAAHDPAVWQATIDPYRRYQSFFRDMMEAGVAEGTLQPVDPEMAAWILISLATGLLLQGLLAPQQADWGHVAEEGIRILLKGLEPRDTLRPL